MDNELIRKVKEQAESLYLEGKFFCSEAIVSAIREYIAPDMPEVLIAAASGFPVGIGGSKCTCGAVSGAVISLGYFFGRTEGGDAKVRECMQFAKEVHEEFRGKHGPLCCSVQTKGMDMKSREHVNQCASFTGSMAAKAAEIIIREGQS